MVVEMLHEEQDEEDEAILSPDSESEISNADDLDYVPQGQSGVVGVNPALPDEEDSSDDFEDLSDESSEEKTETQSNRLIKSGSYWSKHHPTQGRARRHNILRSCPGPAPGLTAISPKDAWDMFISDNIIEEVLKCTNFKGQRVAAAKRKEWRSIAKEEFMAFIV
ncbi:hypothetical protein QQF64_007967 [Cirrhinus molitorella]|uniref:Uncharacterized protein n=1 Tax=Cirrhinus molitorella TaxID=172907 RepID=A0ABR3M6B1_9TELE